MTSFGGASAVGEMRREGETLPVKNGNYYAEIEVPGGATRELRWEEMTRP